MFTDNSISSMSALSLFNLIGSSSFKIKNTTHNNANSNKFIIYSLIVNVAYIQSALSTVQVQVLYSSLNKLLILLFPPPTLNTGTD